MAKKQYKIEIDEITTDILTALEGVNYKLYEVNTVKQGRSDFANRANFDFEEIILKSVTEIDDAEYTDQQLKNYCAGLQKNLYGKPMTKEVRL